MAVPEVPPWLLAGIALAVLTAVAIAAVFLAGQRLFPEGDRGGGTRGQEGGERLRREEIGYYLEAIGEPYETDADVEGHEVAFFLPDRDVAVTFDPRAYLSLEDSAVYAILVEHEMPGVHLGNRLPFETPTFGPASDGTAATGTAGGPAFGGIGSDGGRNWTGTDGGRPTGPTDREAVETSFAVLGLPPDASSEAVRRAYRERVKDVHPDHGGDKQSFERVQEAYATAREHAD